MKKLLLLLGACIVLGSCSAEIEDPESGLTTPGDSFQGSQESGSQGDGSRGFQEDSSQDSQGDSSQGSQGDGSQGSQEDSSQDSQGGGSQAYQAPVFLEYRMVSENKIEFEFSKPVTITSLRFDPVLNVASIEDGSTVRVTLEENAAPGLSFTADLSAEDGQGNTINVSVSLRSRNNRMPLLQINELCTEYSNAAAGKKEEFIELKMKSAGNLGAMRVVILGNTNASKQTIYEFMPVEVDENEYVVLHLRTWDDSCKDEYVGNREESGGVNSSPDAWDFWIPGNTKLMHKAAAAVYVLDQDDRVLDAVMISEKPDLLWTKDYFAEAAGFLFGKDAWKSVSGNVGGPIDAFSSAGTTATRTICRDEAAEDTNTAADWYIAAKSGATPGKPNNTERHQPS
jgi:hypothetical protein